MIALITIAANSKSIGGAATVVFGGLLIGWKKKKKKKKKKKREKEKKEKKEKKG